MRLIGEKNLNWISEVLRDGRTLDTSNKAVRKFAVVMAIVLGLIGTLIYFQKHSFDIAQFLWGIGILFLIVGLLSPSVLRPIYRLWMLIGGLLGGFVSRIILTVLFFLLFVPIGLLLRLMGKDLLSRKFNQSGESYWVKRPPSGLAKEQYRKMY